MAKRKIVGEVLSFKTKIYPNKTQKDYFNKCFGVRRFAWNWGVENWESYKSNFKLDTAWNHSDALKSERPYLFEVNSMIKAFAFKNLKEAWAKVYRGEAEEPKFKSKKRDSNRFTMNLKKYNTIVFSKRNINLNTTKKFGRITFKTAESVDFLNSTDVRIIEWTISERAGMYFISITYERTNQVKEISHTKEKIGIDTGMKTMITSYDRESFYESNLPKRIINLEKKLDRLSRKISRKKYNSYRFKELNKLRNKLYLRIANIKKDFLNKVVYHLATTYKQINFESYDFQKTLKSSKEIKKARTLYRLSPSMLQLKLEQKCKQFNSNFIKIEGKATTQTCSCCGHRYIKKEKLTLKDRVFKCNKCSLEIGRDKNSAINIYNLA